MKRRELTNWIIAAWMVLAFVFMGALYRCKIEMGYFRSLRNVTIIMVQSFLVACWGVNCWRRILWHRTRYLTVVLVLLCLGFVMFRALRWYVFPRMPFLNRFLWYLYYLPMLFIPYIALLIFEGVTEKPYPLGIKLLALLPTILLALVLTNDLHHLVFIPAEDYNVSGKYTYAPLYYAELAWIIGASLFGLVRMMVVAKHKTGRKSGRMIALVGVLVLVYTVGYVTGHEILGGMLDLTSFYITITGVLVEMMIYYGAIPTNTDYEWCFTNASVNMQVLEKDGEAKFLSKEATPIEPEVFEALLENEKELEIGDEILYLHELRGGYVMWSENTAEITQAMEEAKEVNERLTRTNAELAKTIRIVEEQSKFKEGNRLFHDCIKQNSGVIRHMKKLLAKARTSSVEEKRSLLGLINIFGVYIKRRSNLVILNEMPSTNAGGELRLCVSEMSGYLKDFGIEVNATVGELPGLTIENAVLFYDFLEELLYRYLPDIQRMYLIMLARKGRYVCTAEIACGNTCEFSMNRVLAGRVHEAGGRVESETDEDGIVISLQLPQEDTSLTKGGGAA